MSTASARREIVRQAKASVANAAAAKAVRAVVEVEAEVKAAVVTIGKIAHHKMASVGSERVSSRA